MTQREPTGNPQTEHGFTRIANELLEALNRTPMSDYEHRIFSVILREIYGWKGRKTAEISIKDFHDATGIDVGHVSRTLRLLLARKMITRDGSTTGIRKQYREWENHTTREGKIIPRTKRAPPPHEADPRHEADTPHEAEDPRPMRGTPPAPRGNKTPPHEAEGTYKDARAKSKKATSKAIPKADAKASGAERPGDAGTGRFFPDGKPDPRQPEVTDMLELIKATFDLPALDGSETKNRRAAWQLLGRVKKMFPAGAPPEQALQLITAVIIAAKHDDFWRHRLTSAITLNDKFLQIGKSAIARMTGQDVSGRRRNKVF